MSAGTDRIADPRAAPAAGAGGLRIAGIGLCATGLASWQAARAVLGGSAPFVPSALPRLVPARLPGTERRRANATSRLALEAAGEAVRACGGTTLAAMQTVFASADGDGDVLATLLHDLAQERVAMSPTTFHNSVFNAPAGYWSIATGSTAASTTVCAGAATFAAGLLEALTSATLSAAPVLLVAFDHPFPAAAPIATTTREPFACALLLQPDAAGVQAVPGADHGPPVGLAGHPVPGALARWWIAPDGAPPSRTAPDAPDSALPPGLAGCFAGNAAAHALPLLAALARGATAQVALPWLDDGRLMVEVAPCRPAGAAPVTRASM
jgi:hypothetical protein